VTLLSDVVRTSTQVSDDYFATRPRGAQSALVQP